MGEGKVTQKGHQNLCQTGLSGLCRSVTRDSSWGTSHTAAHSWSGFLLRWWLLPAEQSTLTDSCCSLPEFSCGSSPVALEEFPAAPSLGLPGAFVCGTCSLSLSEINCLKHRSRALDQWLLCAWGCPAEHSLATLALPVGK